MTVATFHGCMRSAAPRLLRASLVALLLGCFTVSTAAHAAIATITFEDQPAGTVLANQYSNFGIQFGRDYLDVAGDNATVRALPAGVAYAGTKTAEATFHDCPIEFREQCYSALDANFSYPKQFVALRAGFAEAGVPGRVTLVTTDINGQTQTLTRDIGQGVKTFLRLDAVGADGIVDFRVFATDVTRSVHIDQLEFDVPDNGVTPPPDFGIARTDKALDPVVGLKPGSSVTVPFRVTRFGSTGPIELRSTGAPKDVTVDFSPVVYTDNARVGSFTATFKAAADTAGADKTTVSITARPLSTSAGTSTRTVAVPVTVQASYDISVQPPEIIQAVSDTWEGALGLRSSEYAGPPLVAGKRTTVRGYLDVIGGPSSGVPINGLLFGTRDGVALPGSPLYAEQGTQTIHSSDSTGQQRKDLKSGFTFTLPPSWTIGAPITVTFSASGAPQNGIQLGGGAPPLAECDSCRDNNLFTKTNIAFAATKPYTIRTVWMPWKRGAAAANQTYTLRCSLTPDQMRVASVERGRCLTANAADEGECVLPKCSLLRDPATVVRQFEASAPISEENLHVLAPETLDQSDIASLPYAGRKDAAGNVTDDNRDGGDVKNALALDLLAFYEIDGVFGESPRAGALEGSITLGINDALARGLQWELQNIVKWAGIKIGGSIKDYPLAVIDQNMGGDDMHEIGHALGRKHASYGCGGGANGQVAEDWPSTDGSFATFELGLDIEPAIGDQPAVQRLIGYGQPQAGYDAMSYCAGAGVPWISAKGWRNELAALAASPAAVRTARTSSEDTHAPAHTAAATAPTSHKTFEIRGFVTANGTTQITSSQEQAGGTAPPTKGSPYQARLVDAKGGRLAAVGMNVTRTHIDSAGAPRPLTQLGADLPAGAARRAAGVELVNAGKVLARRKRSRHAPKAKLLKPRIPRGKPALIRYRASDADRGDKLTVTIEYAADGRRFRSIYRGPASRRGLSVASGTIGGGRRARLRLTVDDGWNRTRVLSKRFSAPRAKPRTILVWPLAGQKISSRASLYLHGLATDDRGEDVKQLRWYVGRRLVARGRLASVAGLRPGRRLVRLVARDRRGGTSSSAVAIRVTR